MAWPLFVTLFNFYTEKEVNMYSAKGGPLSLRDFSMKSYLIIQIAAKRM
jgi:hypothetical protein